MNWADVSISCVQYVSRLRWVYIKFTSSRWHYRQTHFWQLQMLCCCWCVSSSKWAQMPCSNCVCKETSKQRIMLYYSVEVCVRKKFHGESWSVQVVLETQIWPVPNARSHICLYRWPGAVGMENKQWSQHEPRSCSSQSDMIPRGFYSLTYGRHSDGNAHGLVFQKFADEIRLLEMSLWIFLSLATKHGIPFVIQLERSCYFLIHFLDCTAGGGE